MSSVSSYDRDDVKVKGIDADGNAVEITVKGTSLQVAENPWSRQVILLKEILTQMRVMNHYLAEITDYKLEGNEYADN